VTAAINGPDKRQRFSSLSKRQERERLFHGSNMFVTRGSPLNKIAAIYTGLTVLFQAANAGAMTIETTARLMLAEQYFDRSSGTLV
jgi:hypothetical protein